MYNQTEAVLAQYDLEIKHTTKGRGSYICDTDKGLLALLPFRGSQERGWALKGYLEAMSEYMRLMVALSHLMLQLMAM